MAIDKLIPQYLNKDDDERVVSSVEMVDALNIRVSAASDGNGSVAKNIPGNLMVAPATPTDEIPLTGYNRVLGCVETKAQDSVYYFLYNSTGRHGIYRYSYANNSYKKLYESSHLAFNRRSFIKADLIINQYGESLLYWTDGVNEPRKINATKLELNQYDETINSGTTEQKELFFTVAKRPPVFPPVFEFQTNTTLRANHLKENVFQFCYQYVYDDGEISALSPYSALAVSSTNLAYNSLSRSTFSSENNELKITVMNSDGPVNKIRVFARRNNDGAFFKVVELNNVVADNDPNSIQSFLFKNDGTYVFLSEEEINKLFDSVPRTAKAEAFSNNRLFYGNYKEGFDNIETSVYAYPVYHSEKEYADADVEVYLQNIPSYTELFFNVVTENNFFEDISSTSWNRFTNSPSGWDWFYLFNKKRQLGNLTYYPALLQGPKTDGNIWEQAGSGGDDSYSIAVYGEGDGMSFIIDTSEYPIDGLFTDSTIAINVRISCSQIGIGTTTPAQYINDQESLNMRFPIQVTRIIDGTQHYSETLYVCTPSAPFQNDSNRRIYESYDMDGNINGAGLNLRSLQLFPVSDIEFNLSVFVPANTSRPQLNQILLSELVQQVNGNCSVSSLQMNPGSYNFIKIQGDQSTGMIYSHEVDDYKLSTDGLGNIIEHASTYTKQNYGISCVASPSNIFYPTVGNQQSLTYNNAFLYLNGTLNFGIEQAEEINNGSAVKCRVVRNGADLNVSAALFTKGQRIEITNAGPKFLDGNGTYYTASNQFKKTNEQGSLVYVSSSEIQGSITTLTTNALGFDFSDRINGQFSVRTAYVNPIVSKSTISIIQNNELINTTFKAGGGHDFGIVYFDHRMRACGVQRINSNVSVSHFGSENRYGKNGRTEIDLRLGHTPPHWSKYWAPVYSKNLTYDKYLQVTIAEACTGNETVYADILSPSGGDRPIIQALDGSDKGTIFLSLRGLEGKNESYKEFKGADLKYSFIPGDKVRILQYMDQNGNTIRPLHEFVITGHHYFQDDEKNPILLTNTTTADEDNYRRTGWFLGIRDEGISGFNQEAVNVGTDFFSQKCLVEIFSPKKNTEKVPYFEIGSIHPIIDTPFGKTHGGDRDNQSIPDFNITITGGYSFSSGQRLYVGDKVLISGQNQDGYVFVHSIAPLGGSVYSYNINEFPSQEFINLGITTQANVQAAGLNGLFAGVVTLKNGDAYLRLREQLVNPESNDYVQAGQTFKFNKAKPDLQEYDTFLIESDTVSDFFDSKATSIGRPHIETPDQREILRPSSVTYSDPYAFDSAVLSLSSFNPSLFPYKDYNSKHGAITYLHDGGEAVVVMQEHRICQQPINRTLIETGADGLLVTSQNVLGSENYYAGDHGPGKHPESVVEAMGRIYLVDTQSGKVVQLGGNGIELISEKKMDSFFESKLAELPQDIKVPCGFDPLNNELLVSWCQYFIEEEQSSGAEGGLVVVETEITEMTEDIGKINFDAGVIDELEEAIDEYLQAVIYIDLIGDRPAVFVEKGASLSEIPAQIKTSSGQVLGIGAVAPSLSQVWIPTEIAVQYGVSTPPPPSTPPIETTPPIEDDPEISLPPSTPPPHVVAEYYGETLAYHTSAAFWLTRYSFVPEMYARLHDRLFTFYNGFLYRHNASDIRSNFYGQQFPAVIEIVSKLNPSMVKTYKALSIEGSHAWPAIVSTDDQLTSVPSYKFIDREGMFYSNVLKDFQGGSTSNKVVLGVVASVTNQTVVFQNRISDAPFQIGAPLLRSDDTVTGAAIASVLSRNSILVSGDASSITQGDVIMAVSDPYYSGDSMRDYYMRIKLQTSATDKRELYAVNAIFETSQLHNQQVN